MLELCQRVLRVEASQPSRAHCALKRSSSSEVKTAKVAASTPSTTVVVPAIQKAGERALRAEAGGRACVGGGMGALDAAGAGGCARSRLGASDTGSVLGAVVSGGVMLVVLGGASARTRPSWAYARCSICSVAHSLHRDANDANAMRCALLIALVSAVSTAAAQAPSYDQVIAGALDGMHDGVMVLAPSVERVLQPSAHASVSAPTTMTMTTTASITRSNRTPDDAALLAALEQNDWSPHRSALALGIPHSTVHFLMRKAGIRRASEIEPRELAAARAAHGDDIAAMARALRVSSRALKLALGHHGARKPDR